VARLLLSAILLWIILCPEVLYAECRVATNASQAGAVFSMRLSDSCTEVEREARAIPAQELLRALASGRGIDVAGVVIHGDLLLDELPVQKVAAVQGLSPEDRRVIEGLNNEPVRVIRGPFVIKNARIQGRIVNRLKPGFLLITGPVVLAQTRFEGSVDLSRTVFLGLVDGSSATFEQESYFVQARFSQGSMFADTHFGPHARFHRSIFAGPAIFRGAVFKGLTEFLEVIFEQDADFSRASFHMGTGFSGAHCRGRCDFSSAQFDHEVFFLFALFDRPVSFASARFESQVDFSDASFKGRDDLAQATFARPPLLTRTARVTATVPGRVEASSSSLALTIALFLMAFGLLLYIIRVK
jgi:hypothetical protein